LLRFPEPSVLIPTNISGSSEVSRRRSLVYPWHSSSSPGGVRAECSLVNDAVLRSEDWRHCCSLRHFYCYMIGITSRRTGQPIHQFGALSILLSMGHISGPHCFPSSLPMRSRWGCIARWFVSLLSRISPLDASCKDRYTERNNCVRVSRTTACAVHFMQNLTKNEPSLTAPAAGSRHIRRHQPILPCGFAYGHETGRCHCSRNRRVPGAHAAVRLR
jgi:hypothetical protein